ncbi:hypothetical protein SpCBS45565_g08351 [Spizellomyces sp. 'palustris']|nr:hypothetical protein SpCBS45565_g08351 [Spizellomyces sp. 'palustris']
MSPTPRNSNLAHSPSEARDFPVTSPVSDTPASNSQKDPTALYGEWHIVQNVADLNSQENDSKIPDTVAESATSTSQSASIGISANPISGPTEVGPETTTNVAPVDRPLETPPAFGLPRQKWVIILDQYRKRGQVECFLRPVFDSGDYYEKRSVEVTFNWKLKCDREYLPSKKFKYSFAFPSSHPGRGAPDWIPSSVFPAKVMIKVDLAPKKIVDEDVTVEIRSSPKGVEPDKVLTIAKSKLAKRGKMFVNTLKISGHSVAAVEEMILRKHEVEVVYMPKKYELDELKDHLNDTTVIEHLMHTDADAKWDHPDNVIQQVCMCYMERYKNRCSTVEHFNRLLPNMTPTEAFKLLQWAIGYENVGLQNTCLEFIANNHNSEDLDRRWTALLDEFDYVDVMNLTTSIVERGLTTLMPACAAYIKELEDQFMDDADLEEFLSRLKESKQFSGAAVIRNLSFAAQNNCPRLEGGLVSLVEENLQQFK